MPARITNRLPQWVDRKRAELTVALTKGLIVGGSHSSLYTPIHTSNLLNSQFRSVTEQGGRIVGVLGYTANYAAYVHDPGVKQTFRRSTAKKEFLRLGFEDAKPLIDRIIREAAKP